MSLAALVNFAQTVQGPPPLRAIVLSGGLLKNAKSLAQVQISLELRKILCAMHFDPKARERVACAKCGPGGVGRLLDPPQQ